MTCIAQWSHWVLYMQAPRIHNKNKRISRYLPYIEQKLFIIGDTTQQVQRRCQIHCDTQSSTNTEDYMQLQWHTNSSHTTETMTHIKTYNTAHAMICQATATMFDYTTLIKKHILCGIQKHMHTLLLPNDPTEWYTCGHHDSIIK